MRSLAGWLVLVLLCVDGTARGEDRTEEKKKSLNVGTFNIRFHNLADGKDNWLFRRDDVAKLLKDQSIDVVGLQEALRVQIDDLAERLPECRWHGVGRNKNGSGEYSPIFYRETRFELRDKGTFWLSPTPEVAGSKGWDAGLPRIASWVKLRDKESGKSWLFMNAHFDHRGKKAVAESARLIRQKAGELAGDSALVVLGDLNSNPKSECYRLMTEAPGADDKRPALRDALTVSAKPHVGPGTTWNGFALPVPGQRIDYIFVGRDVSVETHRIVDTKRGDRFISDHFPVVAELR